MAALDIQFAGELVAAINGAGFSNGTTAKFARDVDIETAAITGPTVYVDGTLSHRRLDRTNWAATVTLTVSAVTKQTKSGPAGNAAVESEKAAWLAFVDDELIALIKSLSIQKRKPTAIDFLSRMQTEALRGDRRFVTRFQIAFTLAQ